MLLGCNAFHMSSRLSKPTLTMSTMESDSLNLAALPTIEEWMSVTDPKLAKTTMAMFRAVKEISYKVRIFEKL